MPVFIQLWFVKTLRGCYHPWCNQYLISHPTNYSRKHSVISSTKVFLINDVSHQRDNRFTKNMLWRIKLFDFFLHSQFLSAKLFLPIVLSDFISNCFRFSSLTHVAFIHIRFSLRKEKTNNEMFFLEAKFFLLSTYIFFSAVDTRLTCECFSYESFRRKKWQMTWNKCMIIKCCRFGDGIFITRDCWRDLSGKKNCEILFTMRALRFIRANSSRGEEETTKWFNAAFNYLQLFLKQA